MYNLIVSGLADVWDGSHFDLDEDRFLEHTDPQIKARLQGLTTAVISELTQLPTVFAYELGVDQPARVGWITSIRKRQGTIRIEFALDQSIRPFTTSEFSERIWDFDINQNEMHRHHWAVKDVDLIDALRETGLGAHDKSGANKFKFSRKTIIAAGSSLKIMSHSSLDHLLLEFGMEGLHHAGRGIGSMQARTNELVKFAIEHPSALTAEGKTIPVAIVESAVEINQSREGQRDREVLWSALSQDGYTVSEGKIISTGTVENVQPPPYTASVEQITEKNLAADEPIDETRIAPEARAFVSPTVFRIPSLEVEANLVSVMMPFDASFRNVYTAIRESCSLANLECKRVDDVWEDAVVMQDVFSLIFRSKIVVVDFSTRNPNVFYETGIAHTLGKPVVPITQNEEDVPFDLRHHRYVRYLNNGEGLQDLVQKLASRLRTLSIA